MYHSCGSFVHMLIRHALIVDVPDHTTVDSEEPVRQRDSVITWSVPAESDSDGEGDGVSVTLLLSLEFTAKINFTICFFIFFTSLQSCTFVFVTINNE